MLVLLGKDSILFVYNRKIYLRESYLKIQLSSLWSPGMHKAYVQLMFLSWDREQDELALSRCLLALLLRSINTHF